MSKNKQRENKANQTDTHITRTHKHLYRGEREVFLYEHSRLTDVLTLQTFIPHNHSYLTNILPHKHSEREERDMFLHRHERE